MTASFSPPSATRLSDFTSLKFSNINGLLLFTLRSRYDNSICINAKKKKAKQNIWCSTTLHLYPWNFIFFHFFVSHLMCVYSLMVELRLLNSINSCLYNLMSFYLILQNWIGFRRVRRCRRNPRYTLHNHKCVSVLQHVALHHHLNHLIRLCHSSVSETKSWDSAVSRVFFRSSERCAFGWDTVEINCNSYNLHIVRKMHRLNCGSDHTDKLLIVPLHASSDPAIFYPQTKLSQST